MSARSAQCQCESSFTCGFCLRNAKPYLFTPRTHQQAMADQQAAAWTPELQAAWEDNQADIEQEWINRTEVPNERNFAQWLAFPGDRA